MAEKHVKSFNQFINEEINLWEVSPRVKRLQDAIVKIGGPDMLPIYGVDSKYGPETQGAANSILLKAQKEKGLDYTGDVDNDQIAQIEKLAKEGFKVEKPAKDEYAEYYRTAGLERGDVEMTPAAGRFTVVGSCNTDTKYPNLPWVSPNWYKLSFQEMGQAIQTAMQKYYPAHNTQEFRASVLSVLMKEQGVRGKIGAFDYNFAGVQTDGNWGESVPFTAQFCFHDKERYRTFASFASPEDGVKFVIDRFVKKNWPAFIDPSNTEFRGLSDKENPTGLVGRKNGMSPAELNAMKWQIDWNLGVKASDYFAMLDNGSIPSKGYGPGEYHGRTAKKFAKSRDSMVKLYDKALKFV